MSQKNSNFPISDITLANSYWLNEPFVGDVFRALAARGHETRIVGGAVRNAIMGVPVSDIDMATTLTPDDVLSHAAAQNIHAVPTGIAHGTVTLVRGDDKIEVTTLRADVDTDGRHANVVFGSDWHEDASRRDFTVNALYCNALGQVFDPLDGIDDLTNRRIRFIGDPLKRISEDYLRILRFIRFHGAYGVGAIDSAGLGAIVQARVGLRQLSRERVWSEFSQILALDSAVEIIDLMFRYGLLLDVLGCVPRLGRFKNLASNEAFLKLKADPVRRLGALGLFTADDGQALGQRFRLSRNQVKRLVAMAGANLPQGILEFNEKSDIEAAKAAIYYLGRRGYEDRLLRDFQPGEDASRQVLLKSLFDLAKNWTAPEFPVGGDALQAHGIGPGPEIGRVLKELEAIWVRSNFTLGRSALLDHLKDLA